MGTLSQPNDAIGAPVPPAVEVVAKDELSVEVASQWQLMWWKFRKNKLAVIGGIIVFLFYFVAIFADFFAPVSTDTYIADYSYAPPQSINFIQNGQFAPYVNGYSFTRDPQSFKKLWTLDESKVIPIGLFVQGEPYKIIGLIPTNIHLIGPVQSGQPFYLMGADKSGRDVFSRIVFSSRISLSIGLVGVALSLILGIVLGGISGLIGGFWDNVIQRLIEITLSIPTLPIIIAFAALVPIDWSVLLVYFIVSILLAFTGWTGLARVVRGKFLALREEDFVLAARLDGANNRRLIFRHMLPSFYSHIIASVTLALPGMILGETALSFLGVGLRPPVVSWGVLLQDAQKINVIASYPWLLYPAFAVIVIVLAFNFLGDGLRDAADPY
ncbi:MAG TPA: ABC transporter permease [Phototrophicaceae bacterium]|nr:ABC transporter permease [Phototrophicaceae bacterium]